MQPENTREDGECTSASDQERQQPGTAAQGQEGDNTHNSEHRCNRAAQIRQQISRSTERWKGQGRNHSQQMAGTRQTVQKPQSRCGMSMPAVVALTTHMQVQVMVDFVTVVMVFMAVQFETEGGAHSQATDHQKRHTHQELRPGRHGLHMGQILDPDRDQCQHHNTDGVSSPPGQTGPQGRQRLPQRERCHGHEVVGSTDHVNSTGGETGEDADQHRTAPKTLILQERSALTTDQRGEGHLHILLTHQRLPHQHSPRTGRLDPIEIRAAEET